MKKSWVFLLLTTFSLSCAYASPLVAPSFGQEPEIVINNIILAKVHDKTISLVDVVKQMDAILAQHYPDQANSNLARYQFFQHHWQETLQSLIDTQLILADAESLKFEIKDVDIREEVQTRFGPNIVKTLDKIGMTYEEAFAMVKNDLIAQKMTWFRAHSKGIISVNPQKIKEAYSDYVVKNPAQEKWDYQVYTVRTKNNLKASEVATYIHHLLQSEPEALNLFEGKKERALLISLSDLEQDPKSLIKKLKGDEVKAELLDTTTTADSQIEVFLSTNSFNASSKSISEAHKNILNALKPNSFSEPIKQASRTDKAYVYRIFHLKEHSVILPPSFKDMENKLKNSLIYEAVNKENEAYLRKLRKRFGFEKTAKDSVPPNFIPFSLK